uniref:NADP-dependent oxidoreductase domain-containing protein n=1 Tax=Ficedula albicollis TaxID=59894 RepID=A0A803WGX0_FICAL
MAAAGAPGPGGVPAVPVASGHSIPVLGLGTSHQGGYSHAAVVHALQKCGIRHIDTAKRYGCESLLQRAIRESGVKREDLWITTKLWHSDYGYESTKKACLESCERLGVEYLGLCKSIGVSNFLISHLEQLKEDCVITPHVNQGLLHTSFPSMIASLHKLMVTLHTEYRICHVQSIPAGFTSKVEYHPFQRPQELVDYCRSRDIVFEGYCPLAKGEALSHPTVIQLARKYSRTPAQICIRWSIQNGIVTIPKSTKAERIEENCKVFDFTIAEDDVEILNGMHDGRHVSWDPSFIV